MKEQYDFSKAERGKFYKSSIELEMPVYLAPDVAEYLQDLALEKGREVNEIVNDWMRANIALVKTMR